MRRAAAMKRISVLAIVLVLVATSAIGLYYFTSPPLPAKGGEASSGSSGSVRLLASAGSSGYITVQYNGSNYQVAAKGPHSPSFACPPGTDPKLCEVLQATCGNGTGPSQEPWKNCYNC